MLHLPKHHRLFYCLIFGLFSFIASAQKPGFENASEAVKKLNRLEEQALNISGTNLDSAMLIAQHALTLSYAFKNDTCFGFSFLAAGWCYYFTGNRDSAEWFLVRAANYFHKMKLPALEGSTLVNLSYVYQDGEDYVKLIKCLKKARPLVEKDELVLSVVDLTMGSTYGDMQLYDQGKIYIFSALATIRKLGNTKHLPSCYSALGYLYMQQGSHDSALYYYRIGYAHSVQLNDIESIAVASDNLGEAFNKKSIAHDCSYCIDSSYYYYKMTLNLYTDLNSEGNIQYAKMNLGSILIKKKDFTRAEKNLVEAYNYFDSINDIKYSYSCSQLLSSLYESLGNYKQAYTFTVFGLGLKDSLDREKRADSISKMFALYETEKRDRVIQLLNTKASLDKEKIERQHLLVWFSTIAVALAILFLILILNRSRIKHQLKEVKVRNQLAADLHDEVGSSLSSILLLSNLANKPGKEKTNLQMLERISSNTKEVIEKMSDIVWMMNPKNDVGSNVREKFEQIVLHTKVIAPFAIHLDIDKEIDTLKFPMETRKNIFLIYKEAVNNALKYAEAKNLFTHLSIINKNLKLTIKDDGKGFDINNVVFGNGLGTMAQRAKSCKASFKINSSEGKGTEIILIMPIPQIRQRKVFN